MSQVTRPELVRCPNPECSHKEPPEPRFHGTVDVMNMYLSVWCPSCGIYGPRVPADIRSGGDDNELRKRACNLWNYSFCTQPTQKLRWIRGLAQKYRQRSLDATGKEDLDMLQFLAEIGPLPGDEESDE